MNRNKINYVGAKPHDNVLVVDDDPDFLERLSCELQAVEGLKIQAAHSPQEAVETLRKNSFQLIVSDWAIHSSTGPDVLREADLLVKDAGRKIPVVFISGDDRVSLTERIQPMTNFEPVTFVLKGAGTSRISEAVQEILFTNRGTKTDTQ